MKFLLKRDTIFATIAVFMVMGLLTLIPLNIHVLDPLKMALTDIDFNDLSFANLKSHRNNAMDEKIVIVNIGYADRMEIAAVINKVNSAQPKAIGLDVLFPGPKDTAADSILNLAITQAPNIVLSNKLSFEKDTPVAPNYFSASSKYNGFVNFVGEQAGVIRYFSPFEKVNDSIRYSFATAVVKASDEVKFKVLQKRSHDLELINYTRQADQYFTIDYNELLTDKVSSKVLYNKIVLLGFADNNPFNIEDKHFTPLNEKFVGKSIPDMNGVVIHANIVSMILEQHYIKKSPAWLNWFLAVMITWIFMAFVVKYQAKKSLWFHLAIKCIQLVLTVVVVYLGIFFNKYLNSDIGLSAALGGIILSVDVLYFYDEFATWANRKFGFKTRLNKTPL